MLIDICFQVLVMVTVVAVKHFLVGNKAMQDGRNAHAYCCTRNRDGGLLFQWKAFDRGAPGGDSASSHGYQAGTTRPAGPARGMPAAPKVTTGADGKTTVQLPDGQNHVKVHQNPDGSLRNTCVYARHPKPFSGATA